MSGKKTPELMTLEKMARVLVRVDPDSEERRRSALRAAGFTDAQIGQQYAAACALARKLVARETNEKYASQFRVQYGKFPK